jgi:tRNA (cmo5U34)-methyltransferase
MKDFTFDKEMTGKNFDSHVREQLPFYSMLTNAVSMIVRNYLPKNGRVYDIGASTGNITCSIEDFAKSRNADVHSIDSSHDMLMTWKGYGTAEVSDAVNFEYQKFDVAVCFLVLMFMTKEQRFDLIQKLLKNMRYGGVIIVVDKMNVDGGYFGTVLRRLTFDYKLQNGATPEQIIQKELSLSGIQRPFDDDEIGAYNLRQFFQLGEFVGWVIEG